MPTLFSPLALGESILPNRIIMAPLTRLRADPIDDLPNALMQQYYQQRASAGLIITEGTNISNTAKAYAGAPGIYTEKQIRQWQNITQAVHDKGGKIALQCYHAGRISHPSLQPNRQAPLAPSALIANTNASLQDKDGHIIRVACSKPRALTIAEIEQIIDDFGMAAKNARQANFDFFEIHAAHAYLINQFLSPKSNQRTDKYGGNRENRQRFVLEVIDNVISHWDSQHIGIRLSPLGEFNGLSTEVDEWSDYLQLFKIINAKNLAYLHISEPFRNNANYYNQTNRLQLRNSFANPIIVAGKYNKEKANAVIQSGLADAVAFGNGFIANPDLVHRFKENLPLNKVESQSVYEGGATGYTSYPFYQQK